MRGSPVKRSHVSFAVVAGPKPEATGCGLVGMTYRSFREDVGVMGGAAVDCRVIHLNPKVDRI